MLRKSWTVDFRSVYDRVRHISQIVTDDRVSVYAAQASFFISISAIPFVMLLLQAVRLIFPQLEESAVELVVTSLPPIIADFCTSVLNELYGKTNFSIVSFSALTLLWSSSRGVKSIGNGIRNIFRRQVDVGYFGNLLGSLIFTVLFVLLIVTALALILFGRMFLGFLSTRFGESDTLLNLLISLRLPLFFAILVLLFWVAYHGMVHMRCPWRTHLPGAVFSGGGWVIFSWLYSLYIDYFANYSYVYGSLAAAVFLMLWLYFCMIIFLSGAEINKHLLLKRQRQNGSNKTA